MRKLLAVALLSVAALTQSCSENKQESKEKEEMKQTEEHYTFELSDKVTREKVTFTNRYGITLTGDLYLPKDRGTEPLPALAISGPYGAVKEQSSGLYANEFAQRGFAVVAFDPSYTGESGGEPRNVASPDIYTEDFSAAIDFLGIQSFIDREIHHAVGKDHIGRIVFHWKIFQISFFKGRVPVT